MQRFPIRVGIFFGGFSREREVSFVGGRTVYDYLDRRYFEPVPIFVDSLGNCILLHWQYLYQGTIREFYPPASPDTTFWGIPLYIESCANAQEREKYIAAIGKKLLWETFSDYFDIAFLCLHGPYGEDGTIQGMLQWYQLPYTGSSLLPSALGLHKIMQQQLLKNAGFLVPRSCVLSQKQWLHAASKRDLLDQIIATLGVPFVVKSSRQGSSIGVTIVEHADLTAFTTAVHKAFFIEELQYTTWQGMRKKEWFHTLIDVRTGIGFPLLIENKIFYRPDTLFNHIESHFRKTKRPIWLISGQAEAAIIIEAYIEGREFSCVVLEEAQEKAIALPPTEILKKHSFFDYRAKYLPGTVGKQTPMAVPASLLAMIRKEVVALFQLLNSQVYARVDGFLTRENQIILNDPNTTAGMTPSSCLFDQAAAIGLNPTQLLTFLIKRSLEVRREEGYLSAHTLLAGLQKAI